MIDKNYIKSTWQKLEVVSMSSSRIDISDSIDVVHVLETCGSKVKESRRSESTAFFKLDLPNQIVEVKVLPIFNHSSRTFNSPSINLFAFLLCKEHSIL